MALRQASLPFLRGGVSRSSLSDTRPLTANEKDPSAPLGMTIREEHFSSAHFIRYSGYPSPTLSFRAQREIFLALRAFLLPSQKVSPFPLSHIGRYTSMQERSLHFGRDDDTGIALSKHIRCTLREINPFPLPSFRAQREIFLALRRSLLLSLKVSPFPLSHIRHYPLLQERSLHFGRDDDTGIALSKHIRCTLREINPFPHTVISSAARNLPRTPSFLAPFAKGFPFSAITHTTLSPSARKIPRLRSG